MYGHSSRYVFVKLMITGLTGVRQVMGNRLTSL